TDSENGTTREFLSHYLAKLGVEVEFYVPTIGAGIEELVKPNTKVIFMESPGSHSFEMQDVPAIVEVAKKHNIWTLIDNTWATPLFFNPLKIGVDVEIQAATKYIGGHSDILLATVSCNEKAFIPMMKAAYAFGQYASPDTIYLAHRGLRSMKVRTEAVYKSAKQIVEWLKQQPEVEKILWPADVNDPGYEIWKRDFTGATGVFGVKLKDSMTDEQIDKLLDSVKLFGLGYSWGGYESLMIRSYGERSEDTEAHFPKTIRISVCLEDTNDLIQDLNQAFEETRAKPQPVDEEKPKEKKKFLGIFDI
ncbi:MAG: PLP-dependent transferase, partial [Burkholderiales bacterium]|nr:PLP-dependent transferase [Burkholderiales bacterium]